MSLSLYSLQTRMTVVIGALVFLSGFLLARYALDIAEQDMTQLVGDLEYALLSSATAQLEQDIVAKQSSVRALAETMRANDTFDLAALGKLIAGQPSLREHFANVTLFSPAGELLFSLRPPIHGGPVNIGTRPVFREAVRTGQARISPPILSAVTGTPVVVFVQPVFDRHGVLRYVVDAAIDLREAGLFQRLEPFKPGKHGYFFVVSDDGVVLHHADRQRLLKNVLTEPGGVTATTRRALDGFEGWSQAPNRAGVPSLIGYRRMNSTNWIVGLVYPVEEAFAPLKQTRQRALLRASGAAAVAGALGWLAIYLLLRPLHRLREQVAQLRRGEGTVDMLRPDAGAQDEVAALSGSIHALAAQLAAAETAMRQLARTDALTDLANRRALEDAVDSALLRAQRGAQVAVAFLDVDHFKAINDQHGHATGDRVLVEFARRLLAAVRETDLVARYAGDEFVILLEGISSSVELVELGRKLGDALAPVFFPGQEALQIHASIGLTLAENGMSRAQLLKRADDALYVAKQAGRNRFHVCSDVSSKDKA